MTRHILLGLIILGERLVGKVWLGSPILAGMPDTTMNSSDMVFTLYTLNLLIRCSSCA